MKPLWHENLILVCEKCGKKLDPAAAKTGENPATVLKDWLKKELQKRSLWGSTRVLVTTCMDVCPLGKVAVAFTSDRADLETTAEMVDPVTERERILHIAVERTKPAPKNEKTSDQNP